MTTVLTSSHQEELQMMLVSHLKRSTEYVKLDCHSLRVKQDFLV